MIAAMDPVLEPGAWVFAATDDADRLAEASSHALGRFREDEGVTLILPTADAGRLGLDASAPMRRITLRVNSALDGVGLTAAVATALADAAIPCNMVAAYHHDHVFVPAADAERALAILVGLQSGDA